jgi:hypothetical protein
LTNRSTSGNSRYSQRAASSISTKVSLRWPTSFCCGTLHSALFITRQQHVSRRAPPRMNHHGRAAIALCSSHPSSMSQGKAPPRMNHHGRAAKKQQQGTGQQQRE